MKVRAILLGSLKEKSKFVLKIFIKISGHQDIGSIATDPSSIAIVCWKGKTNLCVMVSPLDGKELLERISLRFGLEIPKLDKEKPNQEITGSDEQPDCAIETADQECLPESKEADMDIPDAKETE